MISTRDEENKKQIEEDAIMSLEELEAMLERNRLQREQISQL